MAERKTTITHQEYLQAQGLFYLAQKRYNVAHQYENELARLLGFEDANEPHYIPDEIYDGTLDSALEREGIVVEPPAPPEPITTTKPGTP